MLTSQLHIQTAYRCRTAFFGFESAFGWIFYASEYKVDGSFPIEFDKSSHIAGMTAFLLLWRVGRWQICLSDEFPRVRQSGFPLIGAYPKLCRSSSVRITAARRFAGLSSLYYFPPFPFFTFLSSGESLSCCLQDVQFSTWST